MAANGSLWPLMAACGSLWPLMAACGSLWQLITASTACGVARSSDQWGRGGRGSLVERLGSAVASSVVMVAMIDNRSFAPTVFDADGDDVEIVPATVPLLCCTLRPPRTRTLLRAHTPTMPLDCACRHELSRRPFLTVRACVPLRVACRWLACAAVFATD